MTSRAWAVIALAPLPFFPLAMHGPNALVFLTPQNANGVKSFTPDSRIGLNGRFRPVVRFSRPGGASPKGAHPGRATRARNGQALGYVYYDDEPSRRVAVNFAKLPELLRQRQRAPEHAPQCSNLPASLIGRLIPTDSLQLVV